MSTPPGSRVQLALNVSDLDAAVDHYSRLFDARPAKRRPGYANFAIADPPLKLVLFENAADAGSLNHLGTEVPTSEQVTTTAARLAEVGVEARVEDTHTCCYAAQDKAWTTDPDGLAWEIYTVLEDRDEFGHSAPAHTVDDVCCSPAAEATTRDACC